MDALKRTQWLASFVLVLTAVLLLGLLGRVVWIQKHITRDMIDKLDRQYTAVIPLMGDKGDILFADGTPAAMSVRMYNLFADPGFILDPEGKLNPLPPGDVEKARKTLVEYEGGGWTLPPGVHVTPCIYLTHRRPDLWDEPTAFRPERFLAGAPEPYAFIPFGGGTRRCLGAAFATLEMREVLRAVAQRFALAPDRAQGERMRRRSITLTPARGGSVVPEALASSPRHADVLPPQPPDRELPDLQSRAAG